VLRVMGDDFVGIRRENHIDATGEVVGDGTSVKRPFATPYARNKTSDNVFDTIEANGIGCRIRISSDAVQVSVRMRPHPG
jgi:hypothetical protein